MSNNSISLKWSSNLAYAIGLIATDGSLSKDKRHIDFTSKDLDQINNFKNILGLGTVPRLKNSGSMKIKKYYPVQFSNVKLYRFLESVLLFPNKSKTLGEIKVPDRYFKDLLRGLFDGDGYSTSYYDKRWKNSYIFYMGFTSASQKHIEWLRSKIMDLYEIEGKIKTNGKSAYILYFAKYSSIKLLKYIYYKKNLTCLNRKRYKIDQSLCIIQKQSKREC